MILFFLGLFLLLHTPSIDTLSFGSFGQWILYTNATMALHLLYFAACMCEVNLTMDSAMASLEGNSGIRSYPHPTGPRE
jgi:hypothetical protein